MLRRLLRFLRLDYDTPLSPHPSKHFRTFEHTQFDAVAYIDYAAGTEEGGEAIALVIRIYPRKTDKNVAITLSTDLDELGPGERDDAQRAVQRRLAGFTAQSIHEAASLAACGFDIFGEEST